MKPIFLELIFDSEECAKIGIESRDEIEDDPADLINASGLGAVTGGGGGMGKYNIDVDIRIFLVSLNVPRRSKMIRYQPQKEEISVYV